MKAQYNSQGATSRPPTAPPAHPAGLKAIPSSSTYPAASSAFAPAPAAARITPAAGASPASGMASTSGFAPATPRIPAGVGVTSSITTPSPTSTSSLPSASSLPALGQTANTGYPGQSIPPPAATPRSAIPTPTAAPLTAAEPAARILWVDVTRAIAMFFIMWLHARTHPEWMPVPVGGAICFFFLTAGYFLPRNILDCTRRTVQLAIAWLIWSWSTTLLVMIFDPAASFEWSRVFGINEASYNTPLWFLRNLMIFQAIFLALMCLRILPAAALTVCAVCLIWPYDLNGQQHINLLFNWMMAFSAGFALGHIKLARIHALMPRLLFVLAPVAAFLISVDIMEYGFIEAPLFSYGWGTGEHLFVFSLSLIPFTSLGFALAFVIVAFLLASLLPKAAHYLAIIGRNMMFIYAGHTILYGFQVGLDQQLFGGMLGDGVWLPIVAMIVLAAASELLCRYFPSVMTVLGCLSPRHLKWKK